MRKWVEMGRSLEVVEERHEEQTDRNRRRSKWESRRLAIRRRRSLGRLDHPAICLVDKSAENKDWRDGVSGYGKRKIFVGF